MKLAILDLAKEDLIDGYHFYEGQEPGLGSYFIEALYSDIDSLKLFGGIHRQPHRNLYRVLSKRFPFAIYYTLDLDIVWVRAVVDWRKNPSWIRAHLRQA